MSSLTLEIADVKQTRQSEFGLILFQLLGLNATYH